MENLKAKQLETFDMLREDINGIQEESDGRHQNSSIDLLSVGIIIDRLQKSLADLKSRQQFWVDQNASVNCCRTGRAQDVDEHDNLTYAIQNMEKQVHGVATELDDLSTNATN